MVKSTATRNKIKAYFTKNERDIYIERGKYNLEKELKKRKISLADFFKEKNIKLICNTLKLESEEDLYLN